MGEVGGEYISLALAGHRCRRQVADGPRASRRRCPRSGVRLAEPSTLPPVSTARSTTTLPWPHRLHHGPGDDAWRRPAEHLRRGDDDVGLRATDSHHALALLQGSSCSGGECPGVTLLRLPGVADVDFHEAWRPASCTSSATVGRGCRTPPPGRRGDAPWRWPAARRRRHR